MAAEESKTTPESGLLVSAAKAIGTVAGKVAALKGGAPKAEETKPKPEKEHLYRAEYIGSGTFLITKPKRKSAKLRQSRLKGAVRGARS